ncbi:MAG: hypothetical protein KKC64_01430 [Spirochaetes bacterium]|nr:hypothetical protein [Spirochaetota bacterium]
METVLLNGQVVPQKELDSLLGELLEPSTLRRNGGYLFRFGLALSGEAHLALAGAFSDGQRRYHHQLPLGEVGGRELIGVIDEGPVLSIFFKEPSWSSDLVPIYRGLYTALARLLLPAAGKAAQLDPVTRQLIASAGLFGDDPTSLTDLLAAASIPADMDKWLSDEQL